MSASEARAKLTRTLRVTGVRSDGYHLIDAEMVTLDLADTITFAVGDGLTIDGPEGHGVSPGPDNLVARALRAAGRTAAVHIHKRIPAGGGLGGGSADAAAVLRWAGLTDPDVAVGLGADVPFCLRGGRARVRGIGEDIEVLAFRAETYTVSTPPVRCDTASVYRAWDDLGGPTSDGPNDLEPAALVVAPELDRFRGEFGDATGETPILAGSGSTWFVPGSHPGGGRTVVRTTRAID